MIFGMILKETSQQMNKAAEIPKFPEGRIEFKGKFYSESEFKIYENSSKYKWSMFWGTFQFWLFMLALVFCFFGTMVMKFKGLL